MPKTTLIAERRCLIWISTWFGGCSLRTTRLTRGIRLRNNKSFELSQSASGAVQLSTTSKAEVSCLSASTASRRNLKAGAPPWSIWQNTITRRKLAFCWKRLRTPLWYSRHSCPWLQARKSLSCSAWSKFTSPTQTLNSPSCGFLGRTSGNKSPTSSRSQLWKSSFLSRYTSRKGSLMISYRLQSKCQPSTLSRNWSPRKQTQYKRKNLSLLRKLLLRKKKSSKKQRQRKRKSKS